MHGCALLIATSNNAFELVSSLNVCSRRAEEGSEQKFEPRLAHRSGIWELFMVIIHGDARGRDGREVYELTSTQKLYGIIQGYGSVGFGDNIAVLYIGFNVSRIGVRARGRHVWVKA